MKDSNPLIPSGSMLEHSQPRRTRVLSTVFVIVAAHVLPISGLLMMQGCKPDAQNLAENNVEDSIEPILTEEVDQPKTGAELYGEFQATQLTQNDLSMPIREETGINGMTTLRKEEGLPPQPSTASDLQTDLPEAWVKVDVEDGTKASVPDAAVIPSPILSKSEEKQPESGLVEHVIKSGDLLSRLATRYQTTVKDILEANPGVDARRLQLGYRLVVPRGSANLAKTSAKASTNEVAGNQTRTSPTSGNTYVVKAGDTLSGIAGKHGVSLDALRNANAIRTHIIHPGQELKIPVKAVASGK